METELSIHFFVTGACLNILTVKSAMSGNRVQHSFLCDRSLSKHLTVNSAMSGDRVQHSFLCDRSLSKHLDSEECYEWRQSSAFISL